jgi:hypothetical protein
MSRTAVLGRRVTRVTAVQQETAVRRYLAEEARKMDLEPSELLTEYQDLIRRCQDAGAVTREEQLALVADELGVSVEELEAELAMMEAGQA